jgi:hypothetical protein|tara:strand:+ start:1596 stop:2531 length:936 start_codon:yes stop_codon:yes gene_type:complete
MAEEEKAVVEKEEEDSVEVVIEDPKTEKEEKVEKPESELEVQVETETEEPVKKEVSSEEEIDEYGVKVQARMKKLTAQYRKEERDKLEATRLAQQLLSENEQLKSRMHNLDKGYLTEYGSRLDGQIAAAKRLHQEAHESGDTEKMFQAQEQLSKISIEQERLRLAKQRSDNVQIQQPSQGQPIQQQAAPQAAPVRVDPKANAWAEKNEWFGNDEAMTYMAFSIHKKLVEEENLDPESEMYYKEVDRRIREEFPQRFAAKKTVGNQVASAGSSASRNSLKQGRRSVKLSASQVAMAKRLNVPLEQYAKYVKD